MTELLLLGKATAVLAAGLLAARAARRAAASVRALILAATFAILLGLPFAPVLLPPRLVQVRVPQAAPDMFLLVESPAGPATAADAAAPSPPSRPFTLPATTTLVRAAWAAGVMLFAAPVVVALLRLRHLRRMALPWREGDPLVHAIAAESGVRRHVQVFLHEGLSAPMTCGALHPAIGLPMDTPRWNETELRRALVHELEHVRRHDWPIHVLARFVCAAYWFHPLAWVAWRQLCLESERACDDAVLRSGRSEAYADQLLALARRMSHAAPAPLLSMAGRSDLSTRIRAVLDAAQARGRVGTLAALVVAATTAVILATISPLQIAMAAAQETRAAAAQETPAPVFDVASIRRNTSGDPLVRGIMIQPSGRVIAGNIPLRWLIASAYGVNLLQTAGGPDWIDSDRYDIDARGPEGATQQQVRAMLQALLAERASVVVRAEKREQPVFVLERVRPDSLGTALRPAAAECTPLRPPSTSPFPPPPPPPPGGPDPKQGAPLMPPGGEPPRCARMFMPGFIGARQITIADFAGNLRQFVGRAVLDRTGLTGLFDLDLAFAPEFGPRGAAAAPPVEGQPSLSTALREQLGLTLQPDRGMVDVLVIDRVERPTEN